MGSGNEEISELKMLLQHEMLTRKAAEGEINTLKDQLDRFTNPGVCSSLIIVFKQNCLNALECNLGLS